MSNNAELPIVPGLPGVVSAPTWAELRPLLRERQLKGLDIIATLTEMDEALAKHLGEWEKQYDWRYQASHWDRLRNLLVMLRRELER